MPDTSVPLVIIGVGAHAAVVCDAALAAGRHVAAFFYAGSTDVRSIFDIPVLKSEADLPHDAEFIVGIGHTEYRRKAAELRRRFVSVVHPRAVIARDVSLGAGTFVGAGAVINVGARIGDHCIVNTNAAIEHDCTLEDYVNIAPRVAVGGRVFIGEGAVVSIGATVLERRRIEAGALVGAHALVVNDVPAGMVAFGVPAKVIRRREENDTIL